ncbi:MAG: hypothetical protein NZL85_06235, partial [Fimbriimonadales bacterium]|nr:hypothetical protein [Fimbriimonadales bacterium]
MRKRQKLWLWIGLLSAAAVGLLSLAGAPLLQQHQPGTFLAILSLATAAELLLIRYPLRPEYSDRGIWLSVSTPVVMATIVTYGWQFGVWLDGAVSLTAGLLTAQLKNTRIRWVLLNAAQSVLSAAAAGLVVNALSVSQTASLSLSMFGVLALGLLVYMGVNTLLIGVSVAIAESARLRWVLGQSALSLPRDTALMALLSFLITAALSAYGAVGLIGVLAPYLALRQAFVI